MDAAALRLRCADRIAASARGFGDCDWLREAFLRVPRERFVPDRVWWPHPDPVDGLHHVIDRERAPEAWLRAVYRPQAALITQVADGAVRPEDGPTDAPFTSSVSAPAVVVEMLRHLAPRPGERILEIGAGTGYSAALLARRTGPDRVVTVEIDPALASRADAVLRALGAGVEVVPGDGERGHAPGAPYDRLVSTAAVRRVPPAWLHQVRPGGTVLTPLDTPFGSDALARLTVTSPGRAEGTLVEPVAFMKLRGQRTRRSYGELGWPGWGDYRVTVDGAEQRIRTGEG
ncbi:methyltransferase domain-containing protein [Streptomyces sp. NPDC001941]|uniref:methyltransferase domain-containing protein n=1 Tax=Streptomyces sp. NPDC001941 TaxID=3154659 RepID=UPI0033329972